MTNMNSDRHKKLLYLLAMVNTGIWAIAIIALVILLQGHGDMKGLFVILAGGIAVAVQIIAVVSRQG